MIDGDIELSAKQIDELINIVYKLRDPQHGCPWAQQQSYESLTAYIMEEAMETVESIVKGKESELCDELGDLLFQIVFCSVIASEKQSFNFTDIVQAISNKLQRRNPHIFQAEKAQAYQQAQNKLQFVTQQWQEIKATEKPYEKTAAPKIADLALVTEKIQQEVNKMEATVAGNDRTAQTKAYSQLLASVLSVGRLLSRA